MPDAEQSAGLEPPTVPLAEPTAQMSEQTAQLIPLAAVRPDPEQPRHLLPEDLAGALAAGSSPQEILSQLRARAERDKWARERLRELDALAQSIGDDGLLQPIRVLADRDDHYLIEEGERRWWAHHILLQQGREEFRSIQAFVVEPEAANAGVLRRRVAENMLRSEFTAIELARAMASRLQEILAAEPATRRGDAEKRVANENAMSDRRVRQFVALLTLSPEAQELAQQARLTENSLRPVIGIPGSERQLAAIGELMHSTPRKTKSRQKHRSDKRTQTGQHSLHVARDTGRRAHSSRKPKSPRRRPNRKPSRQRITEMDTKRSALRELLRLARLFAKQEMQPNRSDWERMMRRESDREVLGKFLAALRDGLTMSQDANNTANSGVCAGETRTPT